MLTFSISDYYNNNDGKDDDSHNATNVDDDDPHKCFLEPITFIPEL